jgi:hypothetical protein
MNMEQKNQIEIIAKMAKEFPNDQDLGRKYRKFSIVSNGKLDEFCLKYPNDFELGKFLRKKILN